MESRPSIPAERADIDRGEGSFRFAGPGTPADGPLRVLYSAPSGSLEDVPILIVLHGAQRDPGAYRDDWQDLLDGHDVLVLLPEFTDDDYDGSAGYNLGNMVDRDGDERPRDEWAFNVIEPLFDYVVDSIGGSQDRYAIFGHSAGAQFVHRFMEFVPNVRARIAVAANAGWYTVPDRRTRFPYGFRRSPADPVDDLYQRPLLVLLGGDDVDPNDDSLQRDRNTDRQGTDRLTRGFNFFLRARDEAGEDETFNWSLVVVPGAAHSHGDMAAAALPYLFPELR
ncbi:hypothetical protein [Naasia sp. SYSU D00057]|uniref:hypothetical protein n=1 Tax=Naasia sp. SYSU D00057 TaxID=2817380 RepID=UPI001B316B56|nr:hypothetical protein [Naasia sp. SYSU D00057]